MGDVAGKSLGSGSGRSDWRPLGDVVANPVIWFDGAFDPLLSIGEVSVGSPVGDSVAPIWSSFVEEGPFVAVLGIEL